MISTMDQIYKFYDLLPNNDVSKNLLLEPLSCILKISLLQYKPLGTKISVTNNSLQFHEPSFFQGLTRSLGGDSRQDLHNICNPILKCLEWFPLETYPIFYEEAKKGLLQFKSSYEGQPLINHTIDHYLGLLNGQDHEKIEDTAVVSGLKDMWTEKELDILKTMIEHINETKDKESIAILEKMIVVKEQKVNKYIQTISTSY